MSSKLNAPIFKEIHYNFPIFYLSHEIFNIKNECIGYGLTLLDMWFVRFGP